MLTLPCQKWTASEQNIYTDIVGLNNVLDQMDLTEISIEPFISGSKIRILFKCTWNIFKDTPHDRTQNMPQQIQEEN